MLPLQSGFSCRVAELDKPTWTDILGRFSDASLYQTTSFERPNRKLFKVSHLLVSFDDRIVAAAQARLAIVPVLNKGIAYIRWGPLWRLKDREPDPNILRQSLRALKNEFVHKRGLVLRIYPYLFDKEPDGYEGIFHQEGYSPATNTEKDRTLVIDLRPPTDVLRKGLDGKWRNHLNQAERRALEIIEGSDLALFDEFAGVHESMIKRKGLKSFNIIDRFRRIQIDLPDACKMRVFLCRAEGEVCGGLVGSAVGETGITIVRAVNEAGMKNRAAYLLHWRFLNWLKDSGCSYYDVSGINPVRNPGTYDYKSGLCGKNGRDVHFLGLFDAHKGSLSYSMFMIGDAARLIVRKLRKFQKAQIARKPQK